MTGGPRHTRRHPRPRADGARGALAALAATLALTVAACTGTFQEGAPLVLLAATGGPDVPSTVTAFLVTPPGPATPRQVTVLPGGDLAPDLTLPLRAWDWEERDPLAAGTLSRTRLVVLATSEAASSTARSAKLHRYDVSAFDLDAPALAPIDAAPLQLVDAGRWNDAAFPVAAGLQAPEDGVCLVDVAVSSTGRYAALLDRRAACQAGDPSVTLHVIDLEERGLVWSSTPDDVARARLVLDQERGRLDVWLRTATGYAWRQLELESATLGPEVQRVPTGVVDLVAANDARHVLSGGRLRVVTSESDGEPGVTSASGSERRFVPTAARLPVVLIGSDLTVHDDPTQPALDAFARRYVDGDTDTPDQLAYLLRAGAIDTLDLLVLSPEVPLREVVRPAYVDPPGAPLLANPRRVTWFRGPSLPFD